MRQNAAGNELIWVNLADKSTAMLYIKGETSRWVYFKWIQAENANCSEKHVNDSTQHTDYSEYLTNSNYLEQHNKYSVC